MFSEYDFIRLFFAYVRINGKVFIDRDSLRYDLYEFYNDKEYNVLFQDIAVKQQIEGNFLDIEGSLQNAVLYGLLSAHDCNPSNSKRIIIIDEEECHSIIEGYEKTYVEKMDDLTGKFIESKYEKTSDKYHYEGKVQTLKKKKNIF